MREIHLNELKELQIDILKNVHDFCEKYGLRYSLAFGTLLGAIRHKGYIPWDDDIDIMMPREDYEKFINSYNTPIYKIYTHVYNIDYILPYAKVVDQRTIVYEETNITIPLGVNIDVFPIDKVSRKRINRNLWFFRKKLLNYIYILKIVKPNNRRSSYKNFIIKFGNKIPYSLSKICSKIIDISQNYNNLKDQYDLGIIVPFNNNKKWVWNPKIFDTYVNVEFENNYYKSINNWNEILNSLYGDYMTPPPIDNCKSTHHFIAYWK